MVKRFRDRGLAFMVLLCGLFGIHPCEAVEHTLLLTHLTTAEGLPQSTVMTTLRDSSGYVWFGTEDGLVRYDERELRRYAHSPTEEGSLPGQYIWAIAEDRTGDLWIAVKNGGLARWNRQADRFDTYRHDASNPNSLASDNVRSVFVDAAGLVWVATADAGVDILDPATGSFTHLRHDAGDPRSLSSDDVVSFAGASDGSVYIGTNAGLMRWSRNDRKLTRLDLRVSSTSPARDIRVMDVREDRSGTVWIATLDEGLLRLDRDRKLVAYRHGVGAPTSLKSDEVRAVLEDSSGRLWVGTADGLDLLDRSSGTFTHFAHNPSDPFSLRDSFVMSLYEDSDGLLWIGTRSGGVSRWNPRSWLLGVHRPDWLGSEPVTAFSEAPGGNLWVASLNAGLFQYDPLRRERVPVKSEAAAFRRLKPMSLLRDRAGVLWIGTMNDGLLRLAPDGPLRSFPVDAKAPSGTSAAGIMALLQGRDGRIWIGTFGGGVNVLDPVAMNVRKLPVGQPDGIAGANVTALAEDNRGNLWLGSDGQGLTLVAPSGAVLRTFRNVPGDARSLPSDSIYAIGVDLAGGVWVGTEGGGLAHVRGDSARPDSISFVREAGIFETVYGILNGANGELWLSGNTGLQRYSPSTGEIRTFRREDGLQGDEFAFGSHYMLSDGRLAFGGLGGFNLFDPTQLSQKRHAPRVVLSGVSVMGVPRGGMVERAGDRELRLGYRDNIVTLDFGVLDFAAPRGNRLAYRVAGLADNWIDLGTQRRVTLTNLDAGTSVLEVRSASADSAWSEQPVRIRLHRAPAPWVSWWAYAAYGVLILLAVVLRERHRRARAREEREAAARIERLAYFDTLTGLANRQRCLDRTGELIEAAKTDRSGVAVICLDLLGLKRVNDQLGHQVGDLALQAFSSRLVGVLDEFQLPAERTIAGRFGGDEFVLVVKDLHAASLAESIAHRCLAAFSSPIRQASLEYFSAPGVGLAVYPGDGADAGTLFKCAETAVYQARSSGNVQVVAYSHGLADRKRDWLEIESRLRHAVQNETLTLVFQPKIRVADRKLVGVEALMRWTDEKYGEVSPARFIEIAESSGLILDMGRWLIAAVCRQQRVWLDRGFEIPIAINCSGTELLHGDPATLVESFAAEVGIAPSLIEIELTESVLVQDSQAVQKTLERLRSLGCRIALDDFGTGYSSLAYLTRFPPDRIKIDKSFVRDVDRSESGAAVASAILSLAKSLRMIVTAEGVERVGQFDWLAARGCHEIQGFLLGKPVSAAEIERKYGDQAPSTLARQGLAG